MGGGCGESSQTLRKPGDKRGRAAGPVVKHTQAVQTERAESKRVN